jgi:23S rRNA pseudouridine1911/1915/1917 synthase
MVVHPAVGSTSGTLVNALMYKLDSLSGINGIIRPGIVHRLDKDTSGLLVIAKSDTAHVSLAKQIEEKSAKRIYIAVLDGIVKQDSGTIEAPIDRSKRDRKKMAVEESGRYAKTDYRVIERYKNKTLVEFSLHTGRTHQIRVHSKHIGHPVTGDEVYGGDISLNKSGQLLHAARLILTHPVTGEEMTFEAPIPDEMQRIIDKLKKTNK